MWFSVSFVHNHIIHTMIHSISCKNFYSLEDENTLSFVVNDKAPENDSYFTSPFGTRLSKVETIIGANASGKTNVLKLLPLMKWLIIDSFNLHPDAPLPVKAFAFGKNSKAPTELSVQFEMNKELFSYSFVLDGERIQKETLKVKNVTIEKATYKTLFSREWSAKTKTYKFSGDKFGLPKNFENLLRQNASVVAAAMRLNHKMSENIGKYWQKVATNVVEAGWIGDKFLPNAAQDLVEVLNFYSDNKPIKDKAEQLLKKFDLGLDSFSIKKEQVLDKISLDVKVLHTFDNQTYELPFQYASAGTKQLFVMLKAILIVLTNGGIAVLDEFDVNLHPDMVVTLFELFISPDTNPKNAQLIFSTHSHRILEELDKYQITFVEKNENGATECWRLDEVKGVRADDNYYSKYIAGAYGAIPRIN